MNSNRYSIWEVLHLVIKTYSTIDYFCRKAQIPFGWIDSRGYYHESYDLTKKQKQMLQALFSFLKKDTDAELLIDLFNLYQNYDIDWFWDNRNMLYTIDKEVLNLCEKDSLNIVISGVGGGKGFGKSHAALALNIRWSQRDENNRFLFGPSHIFMCETDMENFSKWTNRTRYQLDDPDISTTGSGIEYLRQQISNFSRQSSRYAGMSVIICSAVDIREGGSSAAKVKDIDSIDYYIEMWGYNPELKFSLGLIFTRTFKPLGWAFIPSPEYDLISYFNQETGSFEQTPVVLYDVLMKKHFTPAEFVDHYEQVLKKNFIESKMQQKEGNIIDAKVQIILDDPLLPDYSKSQATIRSLIRKRYPKYTTNMVNDLAFDVFLALDQIAIPLAKPKETIEQIVSGNFIIDLESVELLDTAYREIMFSDEARASLLQISSSPSFIEKIARTWEAAKLAYRDGLSCREISSMIDRSSSVANDYTREARELYIGYLDEFAFSKVNPSLLWQGGNDNTGLADFIDENNKLVISKKCRYDKNWKPRAEDLSREEKLKLQAGWTGKLVLTELQGKKVKSYSLKAVLPTTQPHLSSALFQPHVESSSSPKPLPSSEPANEPPKAPRRAGVVKQLIGGEK